MIGASRAASTRQYQLLSTETLSSSGNNQTISVPAGTVYFEVEMWGAGGGGAGTQNVSQTTYYAQNGAAGGAYVKKTYRIENVRTADSLVFDVGAGGDGVDGGSNTIPFGGKSKFVSQIRGSGISTVIRYFAALGSLSADGGDGAAASFSTTATLASGGVASGGDININGSDGGQRPGSTSSDGGDGGNGANGGAGGAGGGVADGRNPGSNGSNGTFPGGGGGGAASNSVASVDNGGDGADGKVVVKFYG